MKIGFIGGGVMGEAMVRGILNKGIVIPNDITVSDISTERRNFLKEKYGLTGTADNKEILSKSDMIILAVKPQTLNEVMAPLKGKLTSQQLLVSIIAGVTINTLRQGLNHESIVRVMPNTPAQIGEGISVWASTEQVTGGQMEIVRKLLNTLGKEIYVGDEKYLDMATAVSGSGPGFILLIMEAFIDAAVHIGFSRNVARTLVIQTVLGTAKLAEESDKHVAELRNMVTSPGGTTAEGLLTLEEGGLRALISNATIATLEKAKSLGKG